MEQVLKNKTFALLAADGVEHSEFSKPKKALEEVGATTIVVSLKSGEIKSWNRNDWGEAFAVDKTVDEVTADDFDGLMLPGGVMNPDRLRMNPAAIALVRTMFEAGKPIAAICHAPWMLIEADAVKGRTVTSWPSLKTDLENAGATWVDKTVVTDQGIVTSRNPDDIPEFCNKMIEEFTEGIHQRST